MDSKNTRANVSVTEASGPTVNVSKSVMASPDTPAHKQRVTYTIEEWFPAHLPRKNDPHYAVFNATRKRLKKLGRLICWRCGIADGELLKDEDGAATATKASIELHHSVVEYSLANAVDIEEFGKLYPEMHVQDDETFLQFVESEGNLLPLCVKCHRGKQGIHCCQYPGWLLERFKKQGVPAIVQVVKGKNATD